MKTCFGCYNELFDVMACFWCHDVIAYFWLYDKLFDIMMYFDFIIHKDVRYFYVKTLWRPHQHDQGCLLASRYCTCSRMYFPSPTMVIEWMFRLCALELCTKRGGHDGCHGDMRWTTPDARSRVILGRYVHSPRQMLLVWTQASELLLYCLPVYC